jgi:hypothetical protein
MFTEDRVRLFAPVGFHKAVEPSSDPPPLVAVVVFVFVFVPPGVVGLFIVAIVDRVIPPDVPAGEVPFEGSQVVVHGDRLRELVVVVYSEGFRRAPGPPALELSIYGPVYAPGELGSKDVVFVAQLRNVDDRFGPCVEFEIRMVLPPEGFEFSVAPGGSFRGGNGDVRFGG